MHRRFFMKNLKTFCALAASTVGLLVACGGANNAPPVAGTSVETNSPTLTSAQSVDKTIVHRLASARCEQEQNCKNIGAGNKYATRETCLEQVQGSIGNDLNAYNCPRGLDHDAVDRCMAAIQSEECSHPFDTLTRFDKCRTSAMCLK